MSYSYQVCVHQAGGKGPENCCNFHGLQDGSSWTDAGRNYDLPTECSFTDWGTAGPQWCMTERSSPSSAQLGPVSVPPRSQDVVRRANEAFSHWVKAAKCIGTISNPLSRSGLAMYVHSLLIFSLKRIVVGLLLTTLSPKDPVPNTIEPYAWISFHRAEGPCWLEGVQRW